MPTRTFVISAALLLGLAPVPGRAEEPAAGQASEARLQVLLDTIRANRSAMVAVNLGLSDEEAGRFWPVYERYQTEMNALGDRVSTLIQDYSENFRDLSDEKALSLIADYLAIEADRIQVRHSYLPQFAETLPGRTVARFYQIENKMDAVLRYDLAATIPVVEEKASASAK